MRDVDYAFEYEEEDAKPEKRRWKCLQDVGEAFEGEAGLKGWL